MKIRIVHLAIAVPAVFVIGIGASMAFNLWNTESSKQPAKITSGAFAGSADPADIRGSYSFGDIEKAFGIPVEVLARAFGVSAEAAGTAGLAAYQVKNFEEIYAGLSEDLEVGTDSVRWFTALYAGLPYEPEEEGTGLPNTAIPVLREAGVPSELLDAARAVVVELPGLENLPAAAGAGEAAGTGTGSGGEETRTIVGKTTFGQVEDWGVSRAKMAEAMGREPGPSNAVIRDWAGENGVEFSVIKEALQPLVDAAAQ
ncbi:MAG: hypothetical protein JXA15_02560 [Spirochaetales bacterium]|nr:hypothetical protein [Spirochaetales bacterium]